MTEKTRLVLDSSAIFSGKCIPSENGLFTTPAVVAEISPGGRVRKQLEYLLAAGLDVRAPSQDSLEDIRIIARRTGDIGRLSSADIEVLALARELGVSVMSDDYSIQNVAAEAGIMYVPVAQEGIREKVKWVNRCSGCGAGFGDSVSASKECPVCGSRVKTVRSNRKPKKGVSS
jgi:UPF0271 protein